MRKDNIFWGILLVLGGIFLIVSKIGFLGEVNVFSIVIAILLVGIIIKNIVDFHISGILFPLAFIAILFDEQLNITAITPWTVLFAALLGSIGFNLIFGKHRFNNTSKYYKNKVEYDNNVENINFENQGHLRVEASFGGFVKYINTNSLEQVDVDCSFSSLKLYFDNANMRNQNAVLNLNVSFSGMQIYIPKSWRVINNCHVVLGGIEEKNKCDSVITNTITLTGDVSFSGVDIFYI